MLQAAKVEGVITVIFVADDIQKTTGKNRLGELQFMSISTYLSRLILVTISNFKGLFIFSKVYSRKPNFKVAFRFDFDDYFIIGLTSSRFMTRM